jgi:hypothetical protein
MFARDPADIETVVNGLRDLGMDLVEEDDVAGFLGVLVKKKTTAQYNYYKSVLSKELLMV